MNCMYCQGEMKRGTAPFHIDKNDIHIRLDKVPAWICSQCGESYFEESEVETIEAIVQVVDQKVGVLANSA